MTAANPSNVGESDTFDLLIPQHAAWTCGRLIHKIEHFMQVAWLTLHPSAQEQVRQIWPELHIACRGLVSEEPVRMWLQRVVKDTEANWNATFGTEAHAELVLDAERTLSNDHQNPSDSRRNVIETQCQNVLYSVIDLMGTVRTAFQRAISGTLFEFFCLAETVDQAVHPLPAYRFMDVPAEPNIIFGTGWSFVPTSPTAKVKQLPQFPVCRNVSFSELWPEVHMRWRQVGLQTDLIELIGENGQESINTIPDRVSRAFAEATRPPGPLATIKAPLPTSLQTHVEKTVTGTEALSTLAEIETKSTTPSDLSGQTAPHHLGLTLQGTLLSRNGYSTSVEVSDFLANSLLKELLKIGPDYIGLEALRKEWAEWGMAEDPVDGTIRGEISKLRKVIAPLDVSIRSKRVTGWTLQDSRKRPKSR